MKVAGSTVVLQPENGEPIVATYRRRRGSDTWHFCRNCSNWPTSNYEERHTRPSSGEFDNECLAKESSGNCRT